MIVADTCLIFHLFNKTSLTETAQQILDKDPYWIVPPIWKEEYANVLAKLMRKEHRPYPEVAKLLKTTLEEMSHCEMLVEVMRAFEISVRYKISVYDAHFVALAIDSDVMLVTEDLEMIKNCSPIACSMKDFVADYTQTT